MKHQYSLNRIPTFSSFLTIFLINIFLFSGCSTKTDQDFISGTYEVEGLQIEVTEPLPNIDGVEPTVDSTMVTHSFQILKPESRQDTLQIVGLIDTPRDQYGVFAHWENDSIRFEVNFTGHRYTTTGSLKDGIIEIEQVYSYRSRTITSYLKGSRID